MKRLKLDYCEHGVTKGMVWGYLERYDDALECFEEVVNLKLGKAGVVVVW